MHKWNVYVHSTPPYQPFEYSHKDAKLSKGLPSSNKNIHQMLLVHDSKRCNCNSLFGRARVIIFCLYKGFRTHSKLNCALGDAFFFNSLEAILKRTWQLHCTLQKVQEIVHVILNCIVSWSNFQIIAEWCWRFWSYSNDQPARFWFASAYDFHSLLINEIFNLFTFLFLIRDICIFSNILLQRPPSPWLNICMSEWP